VFVVNHTKTCTFNDDVTESEWTQTGHTHALNLSTARPTT